MKFILYLMIILNMLILTGTNTMAENIKKYPVYFSKKLSFGPLILVEPVKSYDQKGLEHQLQTKWIDGLKIRPQKGNNENAIIIDSCESFFQLNNPSVQPVNAYEYVVLESMTIQCDAIRRSLKFRPASYSYITDFKLDENFAKMAPPEMAMVISNDDIRKVKKSKSWFEMTKFKSIEKKDDEKTVFKDHSDGIQTVFLLARGDVNNDSIEDIMLRVENDIEGGSWSSSNVFILTRYKGEKNYTLLEMLRPL